MARNPRELIIETILEGYRQEQRILAGDRPDDADADMFGELFARAQADGKLGATRRRGPPVAIGSDACQRGRSALGLGGFGERSFAEVVARDIAALIAGFNQKP